MSFHCKEKWKILEENTNYEISDQGNVRNILTDKLVKPRLFQGTRNLFFQVRLVCDNKKAITPYVHILVAKYFLKNNDKHAQLIHLGEINDNRACMLQWKNYSENGEKWMQIIDYPNYYVSNLGKIQNMTTKKYLQPVINEHGYCMVHLYNNGRSKPFQVHRLVATYFIPNLENKTQVNHLGTKTDNKACMLEWVTPSENMKHASKYKIKHDVVAIDQIDINTNEIIKSYISIADADRNGYSKAVLTSIVNGNRDNNYKGFIWKRSREILEEEIIDDEKWVYLKDSIYTVINKFSEYMVSDHGRIKRVTGKFLKLTLSNKRYVVGLYNDKKCSVIQVHKIVIMGFNILNPENKYCIDHIDANSLNNKLSNLRWSTHSENANNPESRKKYNQTIQNRKIAKM